MLPRFFLPVVLMIWLNAGYSQSIQIDSAITRIMKKSHIPGLAACTIDSGKIVWRGNYGYASIERGVKVDNESLFMIASVSKTVTAAAVMILYQRGKLKLDDDINKYLPFKVYNPNHKNVAITIRHLLRHSSSIRDNRSYLNQFWSVNSGDPKIELGAFLKEYLTDKGANYDAKENFWNDVPGVAYSYSNIGYSILGLIVERISGIPFNEFCNKNLFRPLNMDHTAWYLKELDAAKVAMPYSYSDSLGKYIPYGHGGYPDYPAGQLRTSTNQLANFLIEWTHTNDQGKVFNRNTIQTLTPDRFILGFHTWHQSGLRRGDIIYSHVGGDNGINSFIGFNPSTKRGLIIFMNGEIEDFKYLDRLVDIIYYLEPK